MKKQNGNYLKLTLYKSKFCSDVDIHSYNLKFEFSKQTTETEKISARDIEFGGKCFFFEIPPNPTPLKVTAVSKTLFFFDSHFATVSIPYSIPHFNDQRQWYYLKNSNEENVIGILTSIYIDIRNEAQVGKKVKGNKNDMSCDVMNSNNEFHNILNNMNMTYCNVPVRGNSMDYYRKNTNETMSSGMPRENTVIYNTNSKSPDISLTNDLQSPYSYRIDTGDKSNFHNKISDYEVFNCNITSLAPSIRDKKLEEMDKCELIALLGNIFDKFKEDEAKIKTQCELLNQNSEKLQQKENILLKEKDKLEAHIRLYKSKRADFEKRTLAFEQTMSKLENDLRTFESEKELLNHEKNIFTALSFLMTTGKHLFTDEEKLLEAAQKISGVSSHLCTHSTAVSSRIGSFSNINKRKAHSGPNANNSFTTKEIVIEKPGAYVQRESLRAPEEVEPAVQKTMSSSHNKFYTPIAQIDLLNKNKSTEANPQNTSDNGEIASPKFERKNQIDSNKLLDSLESLALIKSRPVSSKTKEIHRKNSIHRNSSTENEPRQTNQKEDSSSKTKYTAKLFSLLQKCEPKKSAKASDKAIKKDNSSLVLKNNESVSVSASAHKGAGANVRMPSKRGKL